MWISDISRLSYLICEANINHIAEWKTDKGGIKTSDYIIKPILDYLFDDIDRYIEETKMLLINDTGNLLNNMFAAKEICNKIDNGELNKDIIKNLASYFHLDKTVNVVKLVE